jgi:alpha-ribazole phosphatase
MLRFIEQMEVILGKVFLIRHGEVQWNLENAYVGSTDIPLNDTGRKQAQMLAEFLKKEQISAIYASDLSRARETAEILAQKFDLAVHPVSELREVDYGEWEGVNETDIPKRDPEIFLQWKANPADVCIPDGESFAAVRYRSFPAFCRIAESHIDENIAVVAHKSVNRVILCCLLGMDVNRYRQIGQENACLNIIESRKNGRYVVAAVNDRCHLLHADR